MALMSTGSYNFTPWSLHIKHKNFYATSHMLQTELYTLREMDDFNNLTRHNIIIIYNIMHAVYTEIIIIIIMTRVHLTSL